MWFGLVDALGGLGNRLCGLAPMVMSTCRARSRPASATSFFRSRFSGLRVRLRRTCSDFGWSRRQESNLYFTLRRHASDPLDDGELRKKIGSLDHIIPSQENPKLIWDFCKKLTSNDIVRSVFSEEKRVFSKQRVAP